MRNQILPLLPAGILRLYPLFGSLRSLPCRLHFALYRSFFFFRNLFFRRQTVRRRWKKFLHTIFRLFLPGRPLKGPEPVHIHRIVVPLRGKDPVFPFYIDSPALIQAEAAHQAVCLRDAVPLQRSVAAFQLTQILPFQPFPLLLEDIDPVRLLPLAVKAFDMHPDPAFAAPGVHLHKSCIFSLFSLIVSVNVGDKPFIVRQRIPPFLLFAKIFYA